MSLEDQPAPRRAGRLTQAARKDSLKQARTALFVVGVLTVILQGFFLFLAEKQVRDGVSREAAQLRQQGQALDEVKLEALTKSAVLKAQSILAAFLLVGVAFILLGVFIYKAPLPIAVTALVLYVGAQGVDAAFDPTTIYQGIIIKFIVIAVLISAVRAAFAAERERKTAAPVEQVA